MVHGCNSTPGFVRLVRERIANRLHRGAPSSTDIADDFSLSQRTFQRRLSHAGTSFSDLLDEVRRDTAFSFLSKGGSDMAQLSQLLGYSQQSTLTRAFHRWTGATPTQALKHLGGKKSPTWREKKN